ncbi:hypothetical protein AB1K54_05880 [Microbacterium sp. BWT-B31]|uniref:hypothetical protein n=1 Tax=Microbacterium sp. BWT-B31 TaxID=3232072 RepID=UPI0035274555
MTLDLYSVTVVAALVVNTSGVLFIVETIIRRDEGAGRIWSIAFLAAMLTTIAYVLWSQMPGVQWPIAVGNAAFVAGTGGVWLGIRVFNGRRMAAASVIVGLAVVAAAVAVFVDPRTDDWAGAMWMFVALIAFAGLGAAECLRGALLQSRTAWVLALVLGFQALYYLARTGAFLISGPESAIFTDYFGTVNTAFLTVVLTIVAVVVASVLRASRAPVRGFARAADAADDDLGILSLDAFEHATAAVCGRAAPRGELVGLIAVRIEDLEQISTAFGSDVALSVTEVWREGVRAHVPSDAIVGEDGPTGLLVSLVTESPATARRSAAAIYRGLFDDLGRVGGGVLPVLGVGMALTDTVGYRVGDLTTTARAAARRAAASVETSVLVSDGL